MKKLLTLLLALALAFSMVACATGTTDPATTTAPPADNKPATNDGDDATTAPDNSAADGINLGGRASLNSTDYYGFFNPDYDFSNEDSYKFVFVSMGWDNLTQQLADNFSSWATQAGSEFTSVSCDQNVETFISNIELYASQGYDGFLLNVYDSIIDRVADICDELELKWWSVSEVPRLSTGELIGPYVVTSRTDFGYQLVKEQIAWMQENVADFDPAQTMILVESLTTIKEFTDRSDGAERAWKELLPEAKFEIADGLAEGGISPEIGYNMAATRFTANPDVKFWIHASVMDTFSPGVLRFIEEKGIEDTAILASCGGQDLIALFDAGTSGAWRFAMCDELSIKFNCAFNALYAYVAGWCDYADMWPDAREAGEAYSGIEVAFIKMTPENYKDYLAFADNFTGRNNYPNYTWSGARYPVLGYEMELFRNGTLTY